MHIDNRATCYRKIFLMRKIVIVGASGLGREVYQLLSDLGEREKVKGFLDPDKSVLLNSKIYLPILGTEESYTPESNDEFVVAITRSYLRMCDNSEDQSTY